MFKTKLKRTAINTTLAISALVVLFAMSANLGSVVNTVKEQIIGLKDEKVLVENEIKVTKDSNGINIGVVGSNSSSVNKIEVYDGNSLLKEYTYAGNNTEEDEEFKITIPFGETHTITLMVNGDTVAQKDVQNMRYIYTVADMVAFRNAVNNGNSFSGKYVELMANINLSSVCSSSIGSWRPIGSGNVRFSGMFNGNFYTISNCYIKSSVRKYEALFFGIPANSVIENLMISGFNITNSYNENAVSIYAGGLCGYLNGTLVNCANLSGTITESSLTAVGSDDNHNLCAVAGGLAGYCGAGASFRNCYNKAKVVAACKATSGTKYTQSRAGGVVGYASGAATIENCYNTGAVTSTGVAQNAGGIMACVGPGTVLKNSYNTGKITTTVGSNFGGVTARDSGGDGNGGTTKWGTVTNCYYLSTSSTKAYRTYNTSTKKWSDVTTGSTTEANMKVAAFVTKLGNSAWYQDTYSKNGGYPILRWQIPYFELDKNQVYLKENEQLQLSAVTSKTSVTIGTLTWASSNTSIATVDSTGKVTAVGEGHATIYATESTYSFKAMCVVNVSKNGVVAFPVVATSDTEPNSSSFSIVLKEDGTVWASGSGSFGQLGDGRFTGSLYPVQVMINKDTPLTNVVKIAIGYGHAVALTENGKVYAWGENNKGQLGINNTTNKGYATPVLNYEGTEELRNIVDISAGCYNSSALDKGGLVYTWGSNANGQLGIGNTTDKKIPQVALCPKAVKVSSGGYDTSIITADGRLMSWGLGTNGRLGVGSTTQFTTPQTTSAYSLVDLYKAYNKTIVLSTNGFAYVCGYNVFGDYGDGTTTQATSVKKITTPGSSNIKYISGDARNIVFMMQDGTIWAAGGNTFGQLSNGTTADTVTSYVQAKNADGSYVTDARSIGILGSTQGDASTSLERPHTISYIGTDGNVHLVGSNNKGQFGNGTTTDSLYYTTMGAPYLNYKKPAIELKVSQRYNINSSDFDILEQFNVNNDYTPNSVGTLTFSTESSNISINGNRVTGQAEGYAKIKVEDSDNGYTTYIPVRIVNDIGIKLSLGSKVTVALRNDGEVWTWGSNSYGELGTGTTKAYVDEPEKVTSLNNIKDIDAGYYHVLALDSNGDVYSWGLNNNGQLGDGTTTSTKIPAKITGLSNIVKISAYKYLSLALDRDGNVYAWGEGYTFTPTKIYENIIDISENKLLEENHKILNLDGTNIHNLRGIYEFSVNDDGLFAVSNDGNLWQVYTDDTINDLGIDGGVAVSAGNGFGIVLDEDGNAYSLGVNSSGQLGNGNTTTTTTASRINVQNVEVIAAGEGDHSAIADFEGSIFTTGLNDKGQLGHGNIDTKSNFEIVLNVAIESNVDKIVKKIGESETVDIGLGITLNLKKDLTENSTSEISIVDSTIASLTKNADDTYNVVGNEWGRTFLNATITGNVGGDDKQFATNIEVRIVPDGGITVPQVKAGENFSIALKSNGDIVSWGNNQYGQLGLGNNISYDEPQKVSGISETIVEIAVGNNHVLALTENGTIYGWGLNNNGQVGNGTKANQLEQATVINIYGNELSKIIRVEAHGDNSFAINEDGEVFAWGKDFENRAVQLTQLENAIDVSTSYYVKADGTAYKMSNLDKLDLVGQVRIMDEGTNHTVFLTTGGIAYSIGDNTFGQLSNGNNNSNNSEVVAIRKDGTNVFRGISAVEAGDRYTLILDNDGKVYACGLNENGRLGIDTSTNDTSIPVENANLVNGKIISAGTNHSMVVSSDGTVYSWGKGTNGQLGNREMKDSITPVMVGEYVIRTNDKNIVLGKTDTFELKARTDYFNILKEDIIGMTVLSKNTQVVRVLALADNNSSLTPEEIQAGYKAFRVQATGVGTTNIVLTEAKANTNGILQVEVLPEAGTTISPTVETTSSFTVALRTDGTVWTYGQNTYGELGIGDTTSHDEPQKVTFDEGTIIKQIAVGEYHVAALDTEGNVWTWGRNNYYQLGNSSIDSSAIPIKVTGISKVTRIAAGNNSVMAVTEDNKLVSWGQNAYGELGIGEYSNKMTPTVIEGVHDVVDIQGGKNHYLLLKVNGKMYATGSNLYGQLGINLGERTRTNTFEKIDAVVKFGNISAGWTSNAAVTIDGGAYVWGQNTFGNLGNGLKTNILEPTQVSGLNGIVDADVGKTHTILRDYNQNIYLAGTNSNGQLGDGTKDNNFNFSKNLQIEDVLRISSGNTYSVVMKKDGTVWAWGDYNHGSRYLKSTTNSKVPVQIGSETSSLDTLEMVIKKSDVASILANSQFVFNLIYDDKNNTSDFEYQSLNGDIATVSNDGNVLGIREGSTWVKVTDTRTGKVNVAIIRVVDNVDGYNVYASPKIATGENYTASLKEDGSLNIWGYDESGLVDSDIPYSINVVTTYTDVKSGKNHIIVLRNDGTVWTTGNNEYGQLGVTNINTAGKLVQVPNLTDIQRIAAGDNFCVAMDIYGLTYVWGEGFERTPQILDTSIRNISYMSAGSRNQIVMVLPSGEVYGIGSILNGVIPNFDTAVKVEVGDNYLLILDVNGEVYRYENQSLTKETSISNAIDISVSEDVNMYQSVDEKVYVWGTNVEGQLGTGDLSAVVNPTQPVNNGNDVYTISAGQRNTYVIDTLGHVYASGANDYGQIGNGTKEDTNADSYIKSEVHTIVGDRNFTIEPLSSLMEVNDLEGLDIRGTTYNVFRQENNKNVKEYDVVSNNPSVVKVLENEDNEITGEIKALEEGLALINVRDKVTGKEVVLSRKVVPLSQNRIKTILANANSADAITPTDINKYVYGYTVDVPLDDDETQINLAITTKDLQDSISIDDDTVQDKEFYQNGSLEKTITLEGDVLVIPVTIKTSNGTEFMYELTLNRVSNNNNIDTITVNGYNAIKSVSEEDVYEIIVTDIGNNEVVVTTEDTEASVSIRGKQSTLNTQNLSFIMQKGYTEIPIKVTSKSGKVRTYTLKIYTPEELLSLKLLTVNDTNSNKQEDETYISIIGDDISRSKVYAEPKYDVTYVGINDSEKELGSITKTMITTLDETKARIQLERTAVVDGQETTLTKEYELNIHKNRVLSKVDKVSVNGEILEEENNTYVAYILSNVNDVEIEIQSKDSNDTITLDSDNSTGTLTVNKTISQTETIYTFTIEDSDNKKQEYTLKIIRGETDTGIRKITVGSGSYVVEAIKTDELLNDKEVYEAKILDSYTNVDITVQTANRTSKVDINNSGTYTERIAIENMDLTQKETIIPIQIKSQDEATEKLYYLKIIRQEDDNSLKSLSINELLGDPDIQAVLENDTDDTRYEVYLTNAVKTIEINAETKSNLSNISIDNNTGEIHTSSVSINLSSSITEVPIKVTSEAGTVKTYYLTIYTISDDVSLKDLTVNGSKVTWNATNNRYEIKVDRDLLDYEIMAMTNNINATVSVNGVEGIYTVIRQVINETDETIVNIKVTAANGITVSAKKLAIIEKSDDAGLGYVKINGKAMAPDEAGNYYLEVVSKVQSVLIEVGAQDAYAVVDLDSAKQTRVWKGTKVLQSNNEVYHVQITAEDGKTLGNEFTITIKRLDGNTDIDSIEITYTKNDTPVLKSPELQEDGTYYLKIPRVEEQRVILRITLKQAISTVNVLGTEGTGSLYGYLNLTGEITRTPIIVTAEDGTTYETYLVLEKESNDASLKDVRVQDYTVTKNSNGYSIMVDSNLDRIVLTAIPNHTKAKIKLSTDTDYANTINNREVDVTGVNEVYMDVIAEDNETVKRHTLQLIRTYNTSITSAKVNGKNVTLGGATNVIDNQNADIVITSKNNTAEIYLIKDNTTIATGIGTLNATDIVDGETSSVYTIRVQGPDEYSIFSSEYSLSLRTKSSNNEASILLDGNELTLNESLGVYEGVVTGETHTISALTESNYASVSVNNSGYDHASVSIEAGVTRDYKVVVTAEDGSKKEYTVRIYRKNNNTQIKEVKLKLSKDLSENVLTPDSNGDYYYKVPRRQTSVIVTLTTRDSKAFANINGEVALNTVTKEVAINQSQEVTNVPLKVTAEDGTEKVVNLKLQRESNNTGLRYVKYKGTTIQQSADETYTMDVDNRLTNINIEATPSDSNAKLKVVGTENYVSTLVGENVDINGRDYFEIEVIAEDGETTKTYTVNINRIFNTEIQNVNVDINEAVTLNNKYYSAYVSATAENHTIEVVPSNELAIVTIYDSEYNELQTGVGTITLTDAFVENNKIYKVKVKGPTGYDQYETEYVISLIKRSQDTSAKVFINDVEITKDEETQKYRYITRNSNNKVKVVTTSTYAEVSINGNTAKLQTAEKVFSVNVGQTVTVYAKVISQNGEEEDYVIEIVRLNNNTNISNITVNGDRATKIAGERYRSAQEKNVTEANVVVIPEHNLAVVKTIIDGIEYKATGRLEFTVPLSGAGEVQLLIVVTAEDGTIKDYILNIVQNTSDNIELTVKVNNLDVDELDNSSYRIFVPRTSVEAEVKIKAVDEYTTVSHDILSGNEIVFNQTLETSGDITVVNFTAITELGTTKDHILYIIKESADNSIDKLFVNGTEITVGEDGRYTAYIDNTLGDPTVKVITGNEYAYVRIDNFEEEQNVTEKIVELAETRTTTVPITVRSQSGERVTKYLDIVATFAVVKINEVIVDDVEITDYDPQTRTYTALVENYLTEHEIVVMADNNYATLELAEMVGMGSVTSVVEFAEGEEIKEYTLYVTSETDITTTYTIVIAQKSNNTNLTQVKVNDVTIPLIESTSQYRKNIDLLAEKAKIEVTSEYPYATIQVGDEQIKTKSSGTVWVDLNTEQDEITVPVIVTAADRITIKTYNIVLTRVASTISGNIITDNWEGKDIAYVYAYRTADKRKIGDTENPRELIASTVTLEDGNFELQLPIADTYDLVFKKDSYLTTVIKGVEAIPYDNVYVQTIKLKAGDIDENGEIELDDLVELNDHIGERVTSSNKKYDLNEDDIIDSKDRNLIKDNYHSKYQELKWIDTEEVSLVLPLDSGYVITSEYGYRIHPITGVRTFHSGVDLSGVHHGNIYAVLSGEVTYAGVQSGYGNCIEIKHELNGVTVYSFYAHLSRIDVEVGDKVSQGDVIGLEGGASTDPNPGSSTGHHLHFEMRSASGSGNSLNPHDYLEL